MCTPAIVDAITGGASSVDWGNIFGDAINDADGVGIIEGPSTGLPNAPPPTLDLSGVNPSEPILDSPIINPIDEIEEGIIGGIYEGISGDDDAIDEAVDETVDVITEAGEAGVTEGAGSTTTEETDEDEDDMPELLLGKLASGRRTLGEGRGIGANILTSGSGVNAPARTRRRTLLG